MNFVYTECSTTLTHSFFSIKWNLLGLIGHWCGDPTLESALLADSQPGGQRTERVAGFLLGVPFKRLIISFRTISMTFYSTKTHIGHAIKTDTCKTYAFETLRVYRVQNAQYDRDLSRNFFEHRSIKQL